MKFEISRRAQRELERIQRWWVDHRDERDLFLRELTQVEVHLRNAPEGEVWRRRGDRVIRRRLLPKSQYHLYYEYRKSDERLLIVAIWGAKRGSSPMF